MAIALLGSGSAEGQSVSSLTLAYTCHDGASRKLLVAVASSDSVDHVTGATYDGVALTLLEEITWTSANVYYLHVYYLDEEDFPSTSGAYNVVASASGTCTDLQMGVAEWSGASQGALSNIETLTQATGTDIDLSITIADAASVLFSAVACQYGGTGALSPDSGQTQIIERNDTGLSLATGYEAMSGTGSTDSNWNVASSTSSGQIAIELEPVSSYTDGVGTATGAATVTGIGAATATGVASSVGAATCTGIGAATCTGVGTAAGAATCTGIDASTYPGPVDGVGTAAGVATVTGVGGATATGTGTASGSATVTGIGGATATAVGTAAGSSTCTGVGDYVIIHSAADLVVTIEPSPSLVCEMPPPLSLVVEASAAPSLLVSL